MMNLEMTCSGGTAVIALSGSMVTGDDADTVSAAVSFVPVDDHVVVDLSKLDHVSSLGARQLTATLLDRVMWAEAAVVTGPAEVTVQLVLGGVDRVVPVVTTLDAAIDVIRARSGFVAEVA